MCLCLDWDQYSTSIVVGLSDGSASVVSFTDSSLETVQEWKGHDFELWTASFDLNNPNLVYTGSDDCKFSCWDIRDSLANNWVFQNSKVSSSDGKGEVMESYNKHESLAYGADWYRGKDHKRSLVATCSFYDKLLRLWMPETALELY